ncbi:multidrug resistance-associated protein 1-like isoform X3 [Haemaphysalis longicornis]
MASRGEEGPSWQRDAGAPRLPRWLPDQSIRWPAPPDRRSRDAVLPRHVPAHLFYGRVDPVRWLPGAAVAGLPVRGAHDSGQRGGEPALLTGVLLQQLSRLARQDGPDCLPVQKGADGLVHGLRAAVGGRGDQQHHPGHREGVPGDALRRRAVGRPAPAAAHHGAAVAVPGALLPRRRRRGPARARLLLLLRQAGERRTVVAWSAGKLKKTQGVTHAGPPGPASETTPKGAFSRQCPCTAQMETKDRRSKYVHELFSGIKILKLYAWEEPFRQRVVDVRKKEMEMLRRIAYYFGVMNFVWNCISFLVSLVTFMTFLMVGNHSLDPVTAFVSLALFNTLRFSLLLIPDLIVGAVLCKVALARMKTFLVCEDVDSKQVGESPDEGDAVTMRQAAFSWHRDERVLLRDLSLHLPSGQLIAVVGHVGAGKTSFLSAILGELRVVSGSVDRKGKVAYVPQQAWIQNTTVRQNILLKRQYHSCFYERVVRACQLQTDLSALPAGDQTELGMRGVNLSGGQKQRISLARAVYQNADLYVMDDPLSAVDAQVCSALFHGVIGPRGLLRKKTRVLATHTLSLLPLMDMVIVLKEGQVKEVHRAPFGQRLFDKEQGLSAFLLASPASPQQQSAADAPTPGKAHVKHVHDELSFDVTAGEVSSLSMTMGKRPASQRPCPGYSNAGQLIEEEAFQIGKVLSSVWMSNWSEDVLKAGLNGTLPVSTPWRLAVYGLLGVLQGASILLATLILALCGLNASGSLHDEALSRLVHAPMSFFDTTPLGRILNRFSKDLDQVDYQITIVMDSVLEQLSDVLGILLLISIYIPAFMIAVLPCALVYIVVQKLFVRTFRQLQRLESVSRSPVFNCVAETVPGVQTIRAYAVQRGFVELSDSLLGRWVSCSFHLMAAERWLTVRLNFVGNAVTLVTACLLVQGRELVGPATVGLTLLYALKVTDALNYLVRFTAELENSLIAVERLHEYTRTPTEAEWRVSPAPSPEWPQDGAVQFVNFSVRYRPDLELVLKNINLEVHPSEKVGLVGRTGSGKSSLTLSLFRIVEAAEGKIVIDGVDIAHIGLHDLRSKITIIPQDPVLFCGSLRMNVDPKCEHSDEQIWAALDKAHLKDFFENKSEKLNFLVEEEGKNLSVGQHQLICLARALLRNTKLLVLDEATASVDPETDGLLQKTIRRDFAHCTVLTVAHRLQTILDANRIVVMRAGEIKEIGVPGQLLRDPQSGFYAMAKEAGLVKEKRSSSADRISAPLGTAN